MIGYAKFRKNPNHLMRATFARMAFLDVPMIGLALLLGPKLENGLYFVPVILLAALPGMVSPLAAFAAGLIALVASGIGLRPEWLLLTLFAGLVTFPLNAAFHSCTHNALRPLWLNRVLGEAIGYLHLSGIDEWSTIHAIHHRYPDDPDFDPHPPKGKPFLAFNDGYAAAISKSLNKHCEQLHGAEALPIIGRTLLFVQLRQLIASAIWFALLGPVVFVFFFTASMAAKKVLYVWFNWATHVETENGSEIVDLNHGIYRVMNAIGFNLFLHKSHHERPQMFIPRPREAS